MLHFISFSGKFSCSNPLYSRNSLVKLLNEIFKRSVLDSHLLAVYANVNTEFFNHITGTPFTAMVSGCTPVTEIIRKGATISYSGTRCLFKDLSCFSHNGSYEQVICHKNQRIGLQTELPMRHIFFNE